MRLRHFGIVAFATLSLSSRAFAQFGGGVFVCANCSTEPTAITIKIMHDLEYAKQILQYALQVQQLADAIKNTAHGGPAALSNVAGDLNQLASVVQGGPGIGLLTRRSRRCLPPNVSRIPTGIWTRTSGWHLPKQIRNLGPNQSCDDARHSSGRRTARQAAGHRAGCSFGSENADCFQHP